MARSVPTTTYESPGGLVTAGLWNNGPKALNDFLANRPAFQAYGHVAQSIPNNAWTAINYGVNLMDTDGGHNPSTFPMAFYAEVQGWYWVRASVSIQPGTVPSCRMDTAIAYDGNIIVGSCQFLTKASSAYWSQQASALVQMNPGNYVELLFRQNSGVSVNLDDGAAGIECGFSAFWVHS